MRTFVSVTTTALLGLLLAACGGGGTNLTSGSSSSGSGGGSTGGSGGGSSGNGYSLGNGSGASFQPGAIGLSSTSLSAGGTASMQVTIVDKTGTLYAGTAETITFNSPCIAQGLAVVTASGTSASGTTPNSVATTTGSANATYTAKGCTGQDVITASATVNSAALSATGTVTVAAAAIGSIQFVSATPTTIGLKGTGLQETSTVVFKVLDSSGGPRAGAAVTFTLETTVGDVTMAPTSATSGTDGTVQTVVSAGTQHTTVRIKASIASPALSTESSQLTVTTGLPASAAFSISVGAASNNASGGKSCPNVEAYGIDGITVPVTVRLADRYNNPAPDNTAVAFRTNGGHIVGSCTTPSAPGAGDGTCTATWTSANPRPQTADDAPPLLANGRTTVLATAIGEESFTDSNGNGYWDSGEPFVNLGEPYEDDNENGTFDSPYEYFLDFNKNGKRDAGDGTFHGITCSGSSCSTSTLAISAQHLIIMSTSGAKLFFDGVSGSFTGGTAGQCAGACGGVQIPHSVSGGTTFGGSIAYTVQDLNDNPLAAGTSISVSADSAIGSVSQNSASWTIGCRNGAPPNAGDTLSIGFTAATSPASGNIYIQIKAPGSGAITQYTIPVAVN